MNWYEVAKQAYTQKLEEATAGYYTLQYKPNLYDIFMEIYAVEQCH